jgi:UDP-glucose 4-epimerase
MNVLLVGATGFIGRYVRESLSRSHHVFALSRQVLPPNGAGLTWISADLFAPDPTLSLPEKMDAIIYLAHARGHRDFPEHAWDMFNVNVRSAMAFLEYARRSGVETFIYASSANVYRRSHEHLDEAALVEPTSFYARSKRMAELLLESYADLFRCVVLRLFTVYGPGQAEDMLVPSLIERVKQEQAILVQGSQGLKMSPVYVEDVSAALQLVLEQDARGGGLDIFNIGGEEGMSIRELGQTIGDALNIAPKFEFEGLKDAPGWMSDNSKAKLDLGFRAAVRIDEGIRRTVHG